MDRRNSQWLGDQCQWLNQFGETGGAVAAKVQFGTGTTTRDFGEYRRWLEAAEFAGFDLLTAGDSQTLWADCFSMLTVAATVTSRPRLALTVTNPQTRHPSVSAAAAASVQQISGGRFSYGISSGDSALRNIGVNPSTVKELGEYVTAMKALTAGETVTWEGNDLSLRWLTDPVRVPVWIAAEGPKTQRLAGQIADGVILSNSLTPERLSLAKANIAAGAIEVGRDPESIEIWHMCNLIFAPTEEAGIDSIRSVLAGTANHVFRFTLKGKGLPEHLEGPMAAMMGDYQSRFHAHPGLANPNEKLVDKYGLREYLAPLGTIAGPPEHCVERIQEVAKIGATNLIVSQFVADQFTWMETFAREIAPNFR